MYIDTSYHMYYIKHMYNDTIKWLNSPLLVMT